ncbi:hypothetical protein QYF61_019643 [Mycteria americana]|uniref:Uncharacterized protein n=1 Tax=Mycteria americana TaxID=33587 RepID=A0AAN7MUM7_MYCAM|nr:hypothetical protein QYF61_019643 [Mycteria americana]
MEAKQPQFPQPLPISLVLQTLPQLHCPSLHTLQPLNVSLVVGGPKLNTGFKDAIGFLGHLGTLLAHIEVAVNQHPQVLFCRAAFQPLFPKPVTLHGVAVTQVQDLALSLVEPHTIGPSPLTQPIQVPLQSLPPLKQITPAQLGVICNLTEGALDPLVQIIDKDIKQDWPHHRALGDTTSDRPPTGGWRHNHFPGQPVPTLDNPFCEVKFPNIQSKPLLVQLEAIASRPITCYLGEETNPHLATASFQGVVESDKVSPQPPFPQAKQPQFPQPLPISLVLQTLPQLHCPSLHTLQPLNVSLVVRGPKLNTVLEDAIGLLGHLGTLLAHIEVAVNQHPQVLFCLAAFQPLFPKPVTLHGVAVAQVQDLALGLVKPHTIDLGPSIQPIQVPLQSLPPLKQINTPTQLGVICKLTEGALDPLVQIIDKDIKQDWPQHRALGNTACDRPPTGVNSIHHHSLGPAVQPVLYPAKSTPVQATSSQFLQENAVGNHVKGFTEV